MQAWVNDDQNGIDSLTLRDVPTPELSPGQVLVRMTAAAVVPFDAAIAAKEYEDSFPPATLPLIQGNQGAGIVEDPGDSEFSPGERVMFGTFAYGFMRNGSWAEYVAADAADLYRIPDSLSDAQAAHAVVAYPTAYLALQEAGFRPGQSVLATAVGGSVGNAVVQQAKALGAGNVISTAGSTAKADQAREMGFDKVIDLSRESLPEGVLRLNGGEPVDIVIDGIGGPVLADCLKCVVRWGVVITLGFCAGRTTTITQADMILNRVKLQGFGVYTSTPEEWQEAIATLTRLSDAGQVQPLLDRRFPLTDMPAAVRYMLHERPFGPVALDVA